jgi:hypothetical protein
MGWKAIYKDLTVVSEDDGVARPVQDGQDGKLIIVAQEDYGHSVAIDLVNGLVALEYTHLGVQNGTIEISASVIFAICDETNVVGEFKELDQTFEPWYKCSENDDEGSTLQEPCPNGHQRHPVLHEDGSQAMVRTDTLSELKWRPIWFTRHTVPGGVTKVIGAQVTLPESQGNKNIKKLISIFEDGRIGID